MEEASQYPERPPAADEWHGEADTLAPADVFDPVIEFLKKDLDTTQLRRNLDLTQEERAQKFLRFARLAEELRQSGRRAREQNPSWGLK